MSKVCSGVIDDEKGMRCKHGHAFTYACLGKGYGGPPVPVCVREDLVVDESTGCITFEPVSGWPWRAEEKPELNKQPVKVDAIKEDNERLKARVAEQTAYILRLRKAIIDATNSGESLDSGKWVYSIDDSVLEWPDALKDPANEGYVGPALAFKPTD